MDIEKKKLRRQMRLRRDSLKEADTRRASCEIFSKITGLDVYRRAPIIYSYASFGSEVDTRAFNRKVLEDGKILALPRVLSKEMMAFFKVEDVCAMERSPMGIMEPGLNMPQIERGVPDGLMIVPGLAFDRKLERLGYGGGYYDRYLTGQREMICCCGVAFDCQIISVVPAEGHDRPVNMLITESEIVERMDEE